MVYCVVFDIARVARPSGCRDDRMVRDLFHACRSGSGCRFDDVTDQVNRLVGEGEKFESLMHLLYESNLRLLLPFLSTYNT